MVQLPADESAVEVEDGEFSCGLRLVHNCILSQHGVLRPGIPELLVPHGVSVVSHCDEVGDGEQYGKIRTSFPIRVNGRIKDCFA